MRPFFFYRRCWLFFYIINGYLLTATTFTLTIASPPSLHTLSSPYTPLLLPMVHNTQDSHDSHFHQRKLDFATL